MRSIQPQDERLDDCDRNNPYPLYGERAIAEAELICFDNPRPERL